jgi:hypothetical protein
MRPPTFALLGVALLTLPALAAPPKSDKNQKLTNDEWKGVVTSPLSAAEIDKLIAKEQDAAKVKPAPLTTDEQFLRRVMLDLTGRLPLPADITEFAADKDPAKRAKVIDKLLASDEYVQHWSRYWRDVFTSRVTDQIARLMAPAFEEWLTEQFKTNRPWDQVARELITATGKIPIRYGPNAPAETEKNGAAFFMLAYQGADAINDRTAETARIFLGIQIACAQCHDHPFDGWKQEQFHELASYYAKVGERPMFEMINERRQLTGYQTVSRQFFEHRMPDRDNPRTGKTMSPRFLDGTSTSMRSGDDQRRRTLADLITKDNYWFAAALVNRIWGDLMGQAFSQPIDDMSPGKDVVMPAVLARVSAGFKGSGYDVKSLLRVICNTQTYQRQVRPGESSEHMQFAGAYPTRLPAEALWQSLTTVLGAMGGPPLGRPGMPPPGPFAARFGLEGQFKQEFRFDPSLPPDEVESSIPQALMLMNNPQIQQKIRAEGTNLLGRVLNAYPRDEDAVQIVYLRVLARKPADRERDKALSYIKKVGKRSEAFEDLLWALLNSTEFQTKR